MIENCMTFCTVVLGACFFSALSSFRVGGAACGLSLHQGMTCGFLHVTFQSCKSLYLYVHLYIYIYIRHTYVYIYIYNCIHVLSSDSKAKQCPLFSVEPHFFCLNLLNSTSQLRAPKKPVEIRNWQWKITAKLGMRYWLVVWNMFYFSIWEESSQLTFIFFRGVETTNQAMFDHLIGHYFVFVKT